MSSIAEIRHHIKVVEDTRKITKAMHLISSAKMRRAMSMHDQNLEYFNRVRTSMRFLIENTDAKDTSPYYCPASCERGSGKAAFVVIAGDKGLCGGYNSEVLKLARQVMAEHNGERGVVYAVGHMAAEHFMRGGGKPNISYAHVIHDPNLHNAREMAVEFCDIFLNGQVDEIYLIYTVLEKYGKLRPAALHMLPLLPEDFMDAQISNTWDYESIAYLPSVLDVLNSMVHSYLVGLIYSALVQSYASEHYSRMTAMDAAVRNADQMLSNLKLTLNHARQSVITQEITEIVAGNPEQGAMQ